MWYIRCWFRLTHSSLKENIIFTRNFAGGQKINHLLSKVYPKMRSFLEIVHSAIDNYRGKCIITVPTSSMFHFTRRWTYGNTWCISNAAISGTYLPSHASNTRKSLKEPITYLPVLLSPFFFVPKSSDNHPSSLRPLIPRKHCFAFFCLLTPPLSSSFLLSTPNPQSKMPSAATKQANEIDRRGKHL